MNARNLKRLAVVAAVLVAILVAMQSMDRSGPAEPDAPLVPGLDARLNDIDRVAVDSADGRITLVRESGAWRVEERGGYPADVGKLRELLIALGDARIVEPKTANPALYDRLGVQAPDAPDSRGRRLTVAGDGVEHALIVGDAGPGDSRYVRRDGEAESWLVDRALALPAEPGDWLLPEVIDIDPDRVTHVRIDHGDTVIEVAKESPDAANFTVADIPEGRELRYPSIANGIAGALNDLVLDDVRPAGDTADAAVTTSFRTADGLTVVAYTARSGDAAWVSFEAAAAIPADGVDEAAADGEDDAADTADPVTEAAAINDRLGGWEFRVPGYKADQLTRDWDDLLAPVDDEATE